MKSSRTSVVLPIFKNAILTQRCIQSCLPDIILNNASLYIIDDYSPEKKMKGLLKELKLNESSHVNIIANKENLGFVKSVNIGIKAAPAGNIVILNSDVIVPSRWLSILLNEAENGTNIGTVTPMSNNSTISSMPIINEGSKYLLRYCVDKINESLQGFLPCVEAPTGIGFCMLITEKCIKKVGVFDEQRFGKGYGEENDFCQRAIRKGFVNIISPNIYCHHVGSVSFGEKRHEYTLAGLRTMQELHPRYSIDVLRWIESGPLSASIVIRTLQIYKYLSYPLIAHLTHSLGGGTERYVDDLALTWNKKTIQLVIKSRRTEEQPMEIIFLWPCCNKRFRVYIYEDQQLIELMTSIKIDYIHIHHFLGFSRLIYNWIVGSKFKYSITFHDFYFIGKNPTLTNADGRYEGLSAAPSPNLECGNRQKQINLAEWKMKMHILIQGSWLNIFPSQSCRDIYFNEYKSINNWVVIPHEKISADNTTTRPRPVNKARKELTVAVIGALSKEKGADLLEKIASSNKLVKDFSLKYVLLGYAYRQLRGVSIMGKYETDQNLNDMIDQISPDCFLFTARWPETYSYTLTEAILSGLPIIAPNIGAFPERLKTYSHYLLYDININPENLATEIVQFTYSMKDSERMHSRSTFNSYYSEQLIDKFVAVDKHISFEILVKLLKRMTSIEELRKKEQIRKFLLRIFLFIYGNPLFEKLISLIPYDNLKMIKNMIYPYPMHLCSRLPNTQQSYLLPKL